MPYDTYKTITVSLPLSGHDRHTLLQDVITLLQNSAPIGVMGNYKAVYDLNDNTEGFTPMACANPTKGHADKAETTKAVMLTTYAPANIHDRDLETFLEKLYALHPWEHPGIKIDTITLWRPTSITPKNTAQSKPRFGKFNA